MGVIVTGGAGFIGSCIVQELNDMGIQDIIIVDNIASTEKWKNLVNKRYTEYINKRDFLMRLPEFGGRTSHVIHMGACSDTMEQNFDYLYQNNFEYTKTLWQFCSEHNVSFLYASSAATYGDGSIGFDDEIDVSKLRPLNGYGYSKQLFDLWAEKQPLKPVQHAGFKFFNVYGPNEYHKGSMASVIFHGYHSIKQSGVIKLFKSYQKPYEDGGQLRDFIYVKDICSVIRFAMENPALNGLFNLGTGCARTFTDLGNAVFSALGLPANIEYINMPEKLRKKYQYYTEAKMDKLRKAGYTQPFHSLEEGVSDYVLNYLERSCAVY